MYNLYKVAVVFFVLCGALLLPITMSTTFAQRPVPQVFVSPRIGEPGTQFEVKASKLVTGTEYTSFISSEEYSQTGSFVADEDTYRFVWSSDGMNSGTFTVTLIEENELLDFITFVVTPTMTVSSTVTNTVAITVTPGINMTPTVTISATLTPTAVATATMVVIPTATPQSVVPAALPASGAFDDGVPWVAMTAALLLIILAYGGIRIFR